MKKPNFDNQTDPNFPFHNEYCSVHKLFQFPPQNKRRKSLFHYFYKLFTFIVFFQSTQITHHKSKKAV